MVVAATHAVVFAVVFYFTHKIVLRASMIFTMPAKEGMHQQEDKQRNK
jgi:hypothetical protein